MSKLFLGSWEFYIFLFPSELVSSVHGSPRSIRSPLHNILLHHNISPMTLWNNSTIKYKNSKHPTFMSTIFYNKGIELSWQLTIVHNLSKLDLIYVDTLVLSIKSKFLFYCLYIIYSCHSLKISLVCIL